MRESVSSFSCLCSLMNKNVRASSSQVSLLNCVVCCDPNSAAMRLTAYSFGKLSAMLMWQLQDVLAKSLIWVESPSAFFPLSHMGKGVINSMILLSSLKQTKWGIDYVRDAFKNTYALNELRPAPLALWQVGTVESWRSDTCSNGPQCKVVVGSSTPTYNCSTLDTQLLRGDRFMHSSSVPPFLFFFFFPQPAVSIGCWSN